MTIMLCGNCLDEFENNMWQKWFILAFNVPLIIIGIFVFVTVVPILQPEFTIQCVSAPCIVKDITIYEWFLQH